MERNHARLAELGATNGEYPPAEIDVVAVKTNGLAHPHAGDSKEPQ